MIVSNIEQILGREAGDIQLAMPMLNNRDDLVPSKVYSEIQNGYISSANGSMPRYEQGAHGGDGRGDGRRGRDGSGGQGRPTKRSRSTDHRSRSPEK